MIDLDALELPDCGSCREPSKRAAAITMDVDGPGVPGVIYTCQNRPCRHRKTEIAKFILRKEMAEAELQK